MNREHVRAALAAFWGSTRVSEGMIDAAVSDIGDGQVGSAEFRGFLVGFVTAAKIFDRAPKGLDRSFGSCNT